MRYRFKNDFGYLYNVVEDSRKDAIGRWRAFLESKGLLAEPGKAAEKEAGVK